MRERLDAFSARCRTAGLAVTPQRLAIFRHLAATERHPSAEELHAAVRREMPTLSLATVYKTLNTLAGIGAVRPVLLDKGGLATFKRANPWLAEVDVLPYPIVYRRGERFAEFAGGGIDRLKTRLARLKEAPAAS
jgi:Fe2+ or Zn2+ uptake regulation protein